MGDILWTIQKKSVLEIIEKDGVYYPDNKNLHLLRRIPNCLIFIRNLLMFLIITMIQNVPA